MSLPGGPVLVPALVVAKGTQMTQAWGLETGILIPAWLWGPGLLQPAPNVGCYKTEAQPPACTALLRSPGNPPNTALSLNVASIRELPTSQGAREI
ncbi:hypothetical protein MC885_007063 [Smutsia gigantea]|nr:hypothetical protein MC885_007063 [Smutsia gigantea]